MNEYEAREIISFILNNTNKLDSIGGRGGKRVLTEQEGFAYSNKDLNDAKGVEI